MNARFEGSYRGDAARLGEDAALECRICWSPYIPALGDETRQIPPGTPFQALPPDWTCPHCSAPRAQFMVTGAVSGNASGDRPASSDDLPTPASRRPAAEVPAAERALRERLVSGPLKLVAEFREIWNARMRDLPLVNRALHVEAVGFRAWQGRPIGVLLSPWFMNLILLSGPGDDWSDLYPGDKELIAFPSGRYEFIHNRRGALGGYKACSLLSPMSDFGSQLQATDCARAVMQALFEPANVAETDRRKVIRTRREAEIAAGEEAAVHPGAPRLQPSRRALLTSGLSGQTPPSQRED
jgi:[NiFe] hydrogenase assembly HybE family chaperone